MKQELDLEVFASTSMSDWQKVAESQLRGAPINSIDWEIENVINGKPYYDSSSLDGFEDQISFFKNQPSHNWKLIEKINIKSEETANENALESIENGTDGILFVSNKQEIDFEILLRNLDTKKSHISFLDIKNFPTDPDIGINESNYYKEVDGNPIEKLSFAIQSLNSTHTYLIRKSFKNFFLEVAYLRALSYLFYQIGLETKVFTQVPIDLDPKNQYFTNTTCCLAGVIGGSHFITFDDDVSNKRMVRNVGNVIREECGIATCSDQLGGSYFIESLTNQIITKTQENL